MVTKRDQFTNHQLSVDDINLIIEKHDQHTRNHDASAISKSTLPAKVSPDIEVGNLIYIASDLSKAKQRDRYLVVKVDGDFCSVRKFTNTQLRDSAVRVKKAHCFHVPCAPLPVTYNKLESGTEIDEDVMLLVASPNEQCTSRAPPQTFDPDYESPHVTDDPLATHLPDNSVADCANLSPTSLIDAEITVPQSQTSVPLVMPQVNNNEPVLEATSPRRTQRQSRRPGYLDDYEC